MESVQNNYSTPNSAADVSCKVLNDHTLDPAFMTLSLMADDYTMEEFKTINETLMEDYSQRNQSEPVLPEVGPSPHIISETPCIENLLPSQQPAESETIPLHLDSSPPLQDTETVETIEDDEDVLPPSPVPLNNSRRTPVSVSRSSAFVTMATGSPVLGSLRTLRNIDESATLVVSNKASSSGDSYNTDTELESSQSKTKSMRHIHFESDSGSNHSISESPSSFLSDPSREIDRSLLRPTAISGSILEEESGIEFIEEVKRSGRESSTSPQSSCAIPPAQKMCEPDSASDKLTPSSTLSPPFTPASKNSLTAASYPDPDSQTHEIVDCFHTQDLVSKPLPDFTSSDDQLDSSVMIVTPQLALEVEPSQMKARQGTPPVANPIGDKKREQLMMEENDHREQSVDNMSSQVDTPESPHSNDWVPFEAITRIYDPKERSWHIRVFSKMLPYEKFEEALKGSIADQCKMGLFDTVQSDSIQGSRFETFPELLQRQNQSLLGYSADVSGSIKSDYTSFRNSRLSIASTFETVPIACSSLLSRASLDSQFAVNTNDFAVPKRPVRSRNVRNAELELKNSEAGALEGNGEPENANPSVAKGQESNLTNTKPVRKRGRKPKVLEAIKENDTGTITPPKRGRPRKNPLGSTGTPSKGQMSVEIKDTPSSGIGESVEGSSSNAGSSFNPTADAKSSEDFLQELEEALKDMRNKSYEIGKLVFAQWTDKCYYAAQIIKRDAVQTGKWTVKFDDGQTRSLVEEFILPVSILSKRQSILVLNEDLSEGRLGIVIGHQKNAATGLIDHLVEMDGSDTIRIPRKRICLTQEQIREWNDTVVVPQLFSPHTCNVSLDNILGGKRRRATTADFGSITPQKSPRVPRTPRSKSEAPNAGELTPKSSRAQSTGSMRKKTRSKRDLHFDTSTMSESSGTSMLQQEESSLKERIKNRLQSSLAPSATPEAIEIECLTAEPAEEPNIHLTGPLPENTGIFSGFAFILTRATRPLEIDQDDITDELEPYLDMAPYYKDHIRCQLEAGGGKVLERFDRSQLEMEDTVLVVCNRPCRTERYIRSLAANIRAVSHLWVYECCRRKERLNYQRYYLPPGIDLMGNIVEWSPNTGRCFVGIRMLVHGAPAFCDVWVPVLVQAECVIVSRLPTRTQDNPSSEEYGCEKTLCDDVPFDFVLTTKDCPARITDQANRMKTPLVSSLWVIQSLMHGKLLDPTSRPEFSYNHE